MKTKAQLRKEIKQQKGLVFLAEIHHGLNSSERNAEIAKLVSLQTELGKLNLN